MMYEYMEFADQTLVTHSRVLGEGNSETVQVHFERPKMGGFDSARCELPSYRWLMCDGFTEQETAYFTEFLHHNAHLLFRYARGWRDFKFLRTEEIKGQAFLCITDEQ